MSQNTGIRQIECWVEEMSLPNEGQMQDSKKSKAELIEELELLRIRVRKSEQQSFSDISKNKPAKKEVLDGMEILQRVLDAIPHAVYVKDLKSRFVLVNRAFAKFHGKEPAELVGLNTVDLPGLTKSEKRKLIKQDREVVNGKEMVESDNLEFHGIEGNIIHRHVYKAPLLDSKNRVQGIIGFSENISERIQ
ncbi:MAG: PAS domain-containing protein, partial [SAR324 cluster bacterium]|nr:PAS domain-containing protein [SAR324 cluster bacterium]